MLRSFVPPGLKRRLVPLYNGLVRLSRRVAEYVGALWHWRVGRCEVCGRVRPRLYRRAVVPPRLETLWELTPRLAEALARKESYDCSACGAKLRTRRLARAILEQFAVGNPPLPARSIADWVGADEVKSLRVAEINLIEGLHERIRVLPRLAFSDFSPSAAPGAVIEGIPSEDLTRLTYADGSFDLVLTSETLEHVPDLSLALAEIGRVLVPGGLHIFTVPWLPGVERTYARMTLHPDGTIEEHVARICHPGGDVGYPVFAEFGADLSGLLEEAGFEVSVRFGPPTETDLAQVIVTKKHGSPAS